MPVTPKSVRAIADRIPPIKPLVTRTLLVGISATASVSTTITWWLTMRNSAAKMNILTEPYTNDPSWTVVPQRLTLVVTSLLCLMVAVTANLLAIYYARNYTAKLWHTDKAARARLAQNMKDDIPESWRFLLIIGSILVVMTVALLILP